MQTTINETGPSEYELEITATAEDLAPKIKEALRAQRMRTSMKGFRPGKVPMSLVKKMYGRALALEIAEKSIQETYEKEVVGSDEYDVMGYPKLTTLDYEDVDGDLRAVVKFGVRPPIELQDVEGEQVTRLVHQVTEEDVENEIDRLRKREADMIPKEEEAADEDDYAVIDLQPLDDSTGTPLLGQREEDVSFFMNDPRLKEELREALLGKKMGDTFRVDLPHEGDHDHEHEDEPESELLHVPPKEKEQRAHTHPYQVSLKELMRRELPELTPDWIEEMLGWMQFEDVGIVGPRLLFADEPTGNLDAETGAGVEELLFDLNRTAGTTLLLVTHDLELAHRTERVLRLRSGRLESDERNVELVDRRS